MSAEVYPDLPRAAVGVVVVRGDEVLLVRRKRGPSEGLWAVPGGSVELGETLATAAEREVLEETGIVVRAGRPVHAFDAIERDDEGRVRFHYLVVDVAAEWISGEPRAGDDASAAQWFRLADLPCAGVSDETRRLVGRLLGEES